jgi:hypothetical protein
MDCWICKKNKSKFKSRLTKLSFAWIAVVNIRKITVWMYRTTASSKSYSKLKLKIRNYWPE